MDGRQLVGVMAAATAGAASSLLAVGSKSLNPAQFLSRAKSKFVETLIAARDSLGERVQYLDVLSEGMDGFAR